MPAITLLVADDHNLIRSGICALLKLESDFQIVAEATTGREAVNLALQLSPDIVIMDVAMPLLNGVEATRQLMRKRPGSKVIILSAYEDDLHTQAVRNAGASAYLLKHRPSSEICQAVREVHKGNSYFTPITTEKLRSKAQSKLEQWNTNAKSPSLTLREAEVLQLVAEGFSNKQIAGEIGVSMKTVENHRQSLMMKLNIHCTAGLTRHAAQNGIVKASPAKKIFMTAS